MDQLERERPGHEAVGLDRGGVLVARRLHVRTADRRLRRGVDRRRPRLRLEQLGDRADLLRVAVLDVDQRHARVGDDHVVGVRGRLQAGVDQRLGDVDVVVAQREAVVGGDDHVRAPPELARAVEHEPDLAVAVADRVEARSAQPTPCA